MKGSVPEVPAESLDPEIEAFVSNLRRRLYEGKLEYGDESFTRKFDELHRERLEEAFDVAGWSFVLWAKLKRLTDEHPMGPA